MQLYVLESEYNVQFQNISTLIRLEFILIQSPDWWCSYNIHYQNVCQVSTFFQLYTPRTLSRHQKHLVKLKADPGLTIEAEGEFRGGWRPLFWKKETICLKKKKKTSKKSGDFVTFHYDNGTTVAVLIYKSIIRKEVSGILKTNESKFTSWLLRQLLHDSPFLHFNPHNTLVR